MGLDYAELRRFRKRISDGGSSNRVTEALLEMYRRENLSVDEALKAYSESRFGSDMEAAEGVCDEIVHSVRELIKIERQELQDMAQMLYAASGFFDELKANSAARSVKDASTTRRLVRQNESMSI
ncbi:MAG: hypothetical protein E7337_16820 [Clostridiales bacterium]|nr:hypothetical protein [Clostridiales bacterium]